ncbi:glycosyltransferase family 2 protein [Bizionia argentinensis JUB59]|uniref:Glycosyltransferase family 2 protein n=1 Tax=Bizionia argentinensis JUB59 TaxID=1046627 RepID=G2EAS4_9FLAO|nr:glycosyltransferase family 2 protein [Bizionia argentinensis]EGV44403.1 glycosyltransferase family 2 protein [Bizionia argentinensis JUB59]
MNNPVVTIIMSTYNRAHLILESLQSIENQNFKNWECLIIDDGGTDNTEEVIKPFLNDKRFQYLKRPVQYVKGLPGCRNYGLDIANGNYIIFFDDDDIVHSQNLEICIHFLKNEDTDFIHYKKQSFTSTAPSENVIFIPKIEQTNICPDHIIDVITQKIALASCTVMWKNNVIGKLRFEEGLVYAEEWEFYSRLLSNGLKGIKIEETLYYNKKHKNSNTVKFWSGDENKKKSKIDAANLIISNLETKGMLSFRLMKFFTWQSVCLNTSLIFEHLLMQKSLKPFDRIKMKFYYFGSPLIKRWLRIKKKLKLVF